MAFTKEYRTNGPFSPALVRNNTLDALRHSNKMEKMNGPVGDTEKVMTGVKIVTFQFSRYLRSITTSFESMED